MDPNATLRQIRDLIQEIDELTDGNDNDAFSAAMELLDKFEELDGWLSRGGALPQAWERG